MIIFKFSLLDWIILAILVYSIAISWYKGFVREVLGLVTVLVGALLASWFYRGVAGLFKDVVKTENLALFFGFSVSFLVTLLAGFVTIWLNEALSEFEKRFIQSALTKTRGNQTKAAQVLGVHRNTLNRKISQHKLNGHR